MTVFPIACHVAVYPPTTFKLFPFRLPFQVPDVIVERRAGWAYDLPRVGDQELIMDAGFHFGSP
jgi:hypothetical protein